LLHANRSCQPDDLVRRVNWLSRERSMLDLILIAGGLGFFALSVGYAFACDRL
jgi:hypothetical protein